MTELIAVLAAVQEGGGMYGRNRGNRMQPERGYYMPGKGPKTGTGPGIRERERDTGPKAPSRGEANDYCQHFVDTGQRPQNFLRDVHLVGMHLTACLASWQ